MVNKQYIGLVIDSLVIKHLWSRLCVNTINELKSQWAWTGMCMPSLMPMGSYNNFYYINITIINSEINDHIQWHEIQMVLK